MWDHLVSAPVSVSACSQCGAALLCGLADGTSVRADPTPLDVLAELLCRAAGRRTYTWRPDQGATSVLTNRDRWRIVTRRWPVVPEHRCGQPIAPPFPVATGEGPDPDQPPF